MDSRNALSSSSSWGMLYHFHAIRGGQEAITESDYTKGGTGKRTHKCQGIMIISPYQLGMLKPRYTHILIFFFFK